MMTNKNFTIIIVVVSICLTAAACSQGEVIEGELDILTASGSIRARDLRLATAQGGRIREMLAKQGDNVNAGDIIIILDSTPWELQLAPAEAAVTAAQAELAVLMAGPRDEEIKAAQANIAYVQAKELGAYKAWQNAIAVINKPQELDAQISEAKMQVALAEQGVELAEAQLQPVQVNRDIRAEGSIERHVAEYQVTAAKYALAAAQADLETAQTLLNYLWWIRNEPLGYIAQAHVAEGQLAMSKAEVAVAQAQLQDLLDGPPAEEIAIAEAAVKQAQAEVDLLNLQIRRCTLVSPVSGVVMAQTLNIGELAAPAATILRLADLSVVSLEVYVPEHRIGHVYRGQSITVTVDSYPNRTFEGRVVEIGNEPEFTPRNVATAEERKNTFYAVEIELPNPENLLKPGMPADAAFGRYSTNNP